MDKYEALATKIVAPTLVGPMTTKEVANNVFQV